MATAATGCSTGDKAGAEQSDGDVSETDPTDVGLDAGDAAALDDAAALGDAATLGDAEAGAPDGGSGMVDGPRVWVGTPDEDTGLNFEALEEDDPIPIRMGGQGGTHALIAIQCSGFGNRILYEITLEDLDGGGEVSTLPLPRPQPIICEDDGLCRKSPLLVILGGLAEPEDWDGLHVRATAVVSNADGLVASASVTGYLSAD